MRGLSRRRLLALGFLSVFIQGCSSLSRKGPVTLGQPDETLVRNRAGRFSVQVIETPPAENPRGSQGRFEWLEYQSAGARRRLLLVIGPFGQSLGGVEQIEPSAQQDFSLRVFDEQGLIVDRPAQWQLLSSIAGQPLEDSTTDIRTLGTIMEFLATAAKSEQRVQEIELPLALWRLRFRIALDTQ